MEKTEFTYEELREYLDQLNWSTWIAGSMNMKYLTIKIDTRRNMHCRVYDRYDNLLSEKNFIDVINKMKKWEERHLSNKSTTTPKDRT